MASFAPDSDSLICAVQVGCVYGVDTVEGEDLEWTFLTKSLPLFAHYCFVSRLKRREPVSGTILRPLSLAQCVCADTHARSHWCALCSPHLPNSSEITRRSPFWNRTTVALIIQSQALFGRVSVLHTRQSVGKHYAMHTMMRVRPGWHIPSWCLFLLPCQPSNDILLRCPSLLLCAHNPVPPSLDTFSSEFTVSTHPAAPSSLLLCTKRRQACDEPHMLCVSSARTPIRSCFLPSSFTSVQIGLYLVVCSPRCFFFSYPPSATHTCAHNYMHSMLPCA